MIRKEEGGFNGEEEEREGEMSCSSSPSYPVAAGGGCRKRGAWER